MTAIVSEAGETLAVVAGAGRLAPADRERLRAILLAGGVVVFPTDTVYGIGCNAFHPGAVARVYALKGRAYRKPLPILLAHASQLPLVAEDVAAIKTKMKH